MLNGHQIIVMGNLGRDMEVRTSESTGRTFQSGSVCSNRKVGPADNRVDVPTWWNVLITDPTDFTKRVLVKGARVLLTNAYLRSDPDTGNPRTWTNGEGQVVPQYDLVVRATDVTILKYAEGTEAPSKGFNPREDADIPF